MILKREKEFKKVVYELVLTVEWLKFETFYFSGRVLFYGWNYSFRLLVVVMWWWFIEN